MIRIERAGLWTTVQDAGRVGFQHLGVSISGAADPFTLNMLQRLVGNPETEAGLEMILAGPLLQFENERWVAWDGADFEASANGEPLARGRPVKIPAGGVLDFGGARSGFCAWLAISGGIAVPSILGSRSTHTASALGGWEGRKLVVEDRLPLGMEEPGVDRGKLASLAAGGWRIDTRRLGKEPAAGVLRFIPGPEWDWFSEESRAMFLSREFVVTKDRNRMGARLSGPKLELEKTAQLLSSGVALGTVQVPADGAPIILGPDRQTLGGYPRLATVISADFSALAQLRSGSGVKFELVTWEQAENLRRLKERDLQTAFQRLKLMSHESPLH